MKRFFLHNSKALLCFATLFLFASRSNAQYCTPAFFQGCTLGGAISDFTLNGESGTSITDIGTGCSGTILGGYYDGTSLPAVTLNAGNSYSILVASTPCLVGANNFQVWIDFDNSSTFDVGEEVGGGVVSSSTSIPITIPSTAPSGTWRLRAMIDVGTTTYPGLNPCPVGPPNTNGEAHDYMVTIVAGPSCNPPTVSLGTATCSTKVINWTAVTGATAYQYVIDATATSPTGSGTSTTALTYTATGLTSGSTYYAHVRTDCGGGTYSSWVNTPFSVGPGPISGNAAMCPSSTNQLSDATPGGTWSSSNASAATVNSSGLVFGVAAGSTTITYTVGGCTATFNITVGAMPANTGTTTVCPGSTTTLSNPAPGGTWSGGSPSVATVETSTGIVHGVAAGTTVVTYSASGCSATSTITVSALPAITGGNTVCVGLTLQLSDGVAGGTWSSSAAGTASVTPAGGLVTGVAVGNATITYTLGSCSVTQAITVAGAISPITGTTKFCVNGTTTLSDATAGGTWSSSNPAVATVGGTVTVYGVTAGTTTISYSKGGCAATALVTVDPNNGGTISGPDSVCKGAGHEVTLVASQTGGTWSSSNAKATVDPSTGVVTGVTSSSAFVITYTVTNSCGTFTVTKSMYVRSASKCTSAVDPVAEQANTLTVFPNPNTGTFTINLSSDLNEDVQVHVSNLLGQTVKTFTTKTNDKTSIKLDVAPGIYLLSAATEHGKYVARIVVEK